MTTEEKKLSTAYQESEAVKAAKAHLDQQIAAKPGAYQSQWQTQLNDVLGKIQNREKFSYDINGDALYQQYKDRYTQQGRQAMMDTMAKASSLTGGYGNSYAQTAGQQAYQGYLQGLNDMVPELYQLALSRYDQEGTDLMNQYGLLADREEQDYGRHRDTVADWQTEAARLQGIYDSERDYDYGRFIDDRSYEYQVGRDAVADKQWQAEFDEAKRQYEESKKSSGGGGSSYYGGSDNEVIDGTGDNLVIARWDAKMQNATTETELRNIRDQMYYAGIDDDTVGTMYDSYLQLLEEQTPNTSAKYSGGGKVTRMDK